MTDTTARGMPGEPRRRPDRHLSAPPAGRRLHGLAGPARAHLTASQLPAWHAQTIKENHRVPSSHLQEMRQDHLGRLRPARQAGDGRRPGLPALRRPRQRPRRQRRLAAQALRPRLNRHRITPAIRTDPWCPRRARATSRIAPSLAGGAAAENYDLEQVLASRTPIVFGMLAALGFILLLVALGAPRSPSRRGRHRPVSGRGFRRHPADFPGRASCGAAELHPAGVRRRLVLAATMFAHESAAFGVHVLAGAGGDVRRGCRAGVGSGRAEEAGECGDGFE